MNQLPTVPALGLTLAVPRDKVQQAIEAQAHKGSQLIRDRAATPEIMAQLKRQNWDWTLQTSNMLKECFASEAVAAFFNANVYFEPSLKVDEFERDLDEFPHVVKGRIDRLVGLHKILPTIPEPPCDAFVAAMFHPAIYKVSWKPFERHQFGEAINLAVQEVEDAIKLATAGNIQETGVALVRKAFDPEEGILLDAEYSAADNQGVADLLAGFFGRYKGMSPNAVLEVKQVSRVLALASYLLYILDDRKPKKEESEGAAPSDFEFEFLKPD